MFAVSVFMYGEAEIAHLSARDARLGEVIARIGPISRAVEPDLFKELVRSIVAQQISNKALSTIWQRIMDTLGRVTPESVLSRTVEEIQAFGISFRKARYIYSAAEKIHSGAFDLEALREMADPAATRALIALDGVGVWTAEMLLLFSMQRPNILSFGDLGIVRGLCLLHGHEKMTRPLFEEYRALYSPYGSVASLYLWAISEEG